jgi:hypothetical protein
MELFFNELSLHGQFFDDHSFMGSLDEVMKMRMVAQRFRKTIHCKDDLLGHQITKARTVHQALQTMPIDLKRAVLQWVTKQGPFWQLQRQHSADTWMLCQGEVVTDTSIGEAAQLWDSQQSAMVSMAPSEWTRTPILVHNESEVQIAQLANFWTREAIEQALAAVAPHIESWSDLRERALVRFTNLVIAENAFLPLKGQPFVQGACRAIWSLLNTLNRYDEKDYRSRAGGNRDLFESNEGRFSDSSTSEKHEFEQQLTFHHPVKAGERLFCSWHGKVQTPQLRIHFSWPVAPQEPICVVYVGSKITKR